MDKRTTKQTIESWLPHLILFALVIGSFWLLALVIRPLVDPLLMAAALAALTYPIVFEPMERLLVASMSQFPQALRRNILSLVALGFFLVILTLPVLIVAVLTTGSIPQLWEMAFGIIRNDPEQINAALDLVTTQADKLRGLYPRLLLPENSEIRQYLQSLLDDSLRFAPTFMRFLMHGLRGTGNLLAQTVLTIIALIFFYAHGSAIIRKILIQTPLSSARIDDVFRSHRQIVLRLLFDTVATAVTKGLLIGLVASFLTGINIVLIALPAIFISLIPMIGTTIVWLPLASLLWAQNHPWLAVLLAVASLLVEFTVEWYRRRLGKHIYDQGAWMSFMLFISLIGGILSFGFKGFVLGPMIFVLAAVIATHWLPLYRERGGEKVESSM